MTRAALFPMLACACTTIADPAPADPVAPVDAGAPETDAPTVPSPACRVDQRAEGFRADGARFTRPDGKRLFIANLIYANAGVSNLYALSFAGDLAGATHDVVDLASTDLATCTTCAFSLSPCNTKTGTCEYQVYVPVSGAMRVVRMPDDADQTFWLELDRATFVRATVKDNHVTELQQDDCLYNEHTLLSGVAAPFVLENCSPGLSKLLCDLADRDPQ